MRFERHAKIFRGQLDPAPVAGVFFLLLIFILLGNLLYTPGVLVEIGTDALITVARNSVQFRGQTYTNLDNLDELRQDLSATQATGQPVRIKIAPGGSSRVAERIKNMLLIEPPSVEPRLASEMLGTTNPVALVAVNLRGQFFFENQLLNETQLVGQLRKRQKEATNLTLVLLNDNAVSQKTVVRIASLAGDIGIRNMILATRPETFSTNR
jgi:biopolymer transport protein ExbD